MISVSLAFSQIPANTVKTMDTGLVHHMVPVCNTAYPRTKLYCLVTEAYKCM